MNNDRGFTLIELLAVITVIVLLVIIITPAVYRMINKNNENSCDSFINSIESAADMYAKEDKYALNLSCTYNSTLVTLRTLYDYDYLSGKVIDDSYFKNPLNQNRNFMLSDTVTITYDCSTKTFSYLYSNSDICD